MMDAGRAETLLFYFKSHYKLFFIGFKHFGLRFLCP